MRIELPLLPLLSLCLVSSAVVNGCGGGSSVSGSSGGGGNQGGGQQAPTVTSISPASVTAGSGQLTLTVNGTGFSSTTTVQVAAVAEPTTYASSTQVTATISAAQIASGGELAVIALNGTASSGSGIDLQVTNPAPAIASVTPATVAAGAPSTAIAVSGTGFVPTTQIDVNGNARTTTFASSTEVSVTLQAADVAVGGDLSLTAVNSTPGGGTSTAATIAVTDPLPSVSAVSPGTVLTGTTATTVTVTGTGFVATSTVLLNGTSTATKYVSATQLTFSLPPQTTAQFETVAVSNPAPGGGLAQANEDLLILTPTPAPAIASVSPTQFVMGSGGSTLEVFGSNFEEQAGAFSVFTATVMWNGIPLSTFGQGSGANQELMAQVPGDLLSAIGSATVTVTTTTSASASNAVTVAITNPPAPTLTSISPGGGPLNALTQVTLEGAGFTAGSTVAVNGNSVPSEFVSSTEITATIPAAAVPGNLNVTVTTPPPGGGTSAGVPFTAYIGIANNDIAYNSADGLLYASVPGSVAGTGNSVVGIDPVTGNVIRQIWVGSNPNKLALSTDGTQLFVGLDGAGAVAQVNLTSGQVVNQFSLGGGEGIYNPPFTALYLAAVPGSPNSVAVGASGGLTGAAGVTIYDSGVARAETSSSLGYGTGPLGFGSTSPALYMWSSAGVVQLTVGSTGVTAGSVLNSSSTFSCCTGNLQYDNGVIYLSNGEALSATTGTLLGTFDATASAAASGPIVSDSTLGVAFVASSSIATSTSSILAFNESTFNPTGSIPFFGNSATSPEKIVRWGQDGVALNSGEEIFIFQSPVVEDLSSSPADLSVSLAAPETATTGSAISYVATVNNNGPNAAEGATLALTLDSTLIVNSITPNQGSCGTGSAFTCDLGDLANGASATVTVSATPTSAQHIEGAASVTSVSYDPVLTNNQSTDSTRVSGNFYAMTPALSSISPPLVQAGSGAFTLTVNGSGFNENSIVNVGGSAMATTYVSATELTAGVTAAAIANYGWTPVTVTNAAPGGGASAIAPLTIYATVNVPANSILFDPFSQNLYATVPSTATNLTGNTIVAINPYTGAVGTPITIGSDPGPMAETSDGDYLYIGLSGADSLAQFDLLSQSLTATIPLAVTQGTTSTSFAASWLAAVPGTDNTLAVNQSGEGGTFGIFDVSGDTGSFRANFSGIYEGDNPVFASATELYAYDDQTTGAEFYRYSINANGLTLMDGTTLDGMGGFGGGFVLAGGLVYGGAGGIANPATTPPSQVATLSPIDFYQAGLNADEAAGVVADSSTEKDFLMLANTAGTWAYGLVRYDTVHYLPEASLIMPSSASGVDANWTMQRFGQDGIALLSNDSIGESQPAVVLMLLEGPFVTPQLLNTGAAAASLTASSATSIAHGAGNTVLTLTGTNFLPGVAVTWNGSYRTTTIEDASHVTVAIPASDLANAGNGSLVATNPGAAASNALTVTIN